MTTRFPLLLLISFLYINNTYTQAQQPNVVFILVDDLGWADLSCYGSEFYETPNLDRLAKKSVRFTQAYTASPVCSPTRAAIMTGKHPARLRITDWIPGQDPQDKKLLGPDDLHQLPLNELTLAEVFQEQGYQTFFAGKWHLGGEGFYPEDQGFDKNFGGHDKGSPPGGYYSPYNNPKLQDGPEGEYLPNRLTRESLNFMEAHAEAPFFLYLSFYTVHTPIQASKAHIDKFEAKYAMKVDYDPDHIREDEGFTKLYQDNPAYASMVYAMDENVGKIMDKLDELSLMDNTIIVFTSDNGGLSTLFRENAPTANLPLRAGKGWCYEGGIRVPTMIYAPSISHQGIETHVPIISMDFYPTLLELANIPLKPKQHVDGISLLPLLTGENELKRDRLYWHFPHYHGSAWTPGSAIRIGDYKLIEFYDREKYELYDMKNDWEEKNDLASEMPRKAKKLHKQLFKALKKVDAQMPLLNR